MHNCPGGNGSSALVADIESLLNSDPLLADLTSSLLTDTGVEQSDTSAAAMSDGSAAVIKLEPLTQSLDRPPSASRRAVAGTGLLGQLLDEGAAGGSESDGAMTRAHRPSSLAVSPAYLHHHHQQQQQLHQQPRGN